MTKPICRPFIYSSVNGSPASGEYSLFIEPEPEGAISKVVILACGLSLWNSDAGRDAFLNRVFDTELRGVRADFARFICVVEPLVPEPHAKAFKIISNLAEYKRRGHPTNTDGSVDSSNIVGGSTTFSTDFDNGSLVPAREIKALLAAGGISKSS
jgi:hypothetical protein